MRKNFFRTFVAALVMGSMLVTPAFAQEASVTGSDVNVRSGPGVNYPIVDNLPRNAVIEVTDQSNGDWYAISYDGGSGFMSSRYIGFMDSGSVTTPPAQDSSNESSGSTAYINAMYVRFRSGPGSNYSILGEYNSGKAVEVLGEESGWTKCIINGKTGYVYSDYVSSSAPSNDSSLSQGASSDGVIIIGSGYDKTEEKEEDKSSEIVVMPSTPTPTPAPTPSPTPAPVITPAPENNSGTVIIPGASQETPKPESTPAPTPSPAPGVQPEEKAEGFINAMYVRFRSGPGTSYSILGTYNKGEALSIIGTSGDWTRCTINGQEGYVFTSYVTKKALASVTPDKPEASQPQATPTPSAPPVVENTTSKPGYINGNNVRFRSAPSTSSQIISELYFGNSLTITGKSGDWTAVNCNGQNGFVFSTYVTEGEYKYSSTGGTATGREIADFALQYVGYNYCWGGKDPSTGFDCSGLMYYVYSQFGYTLNRVASDQARNGVHVDPSDLQPGDLLCFYSSGSYIGHVGMYIGDNQFVHASTSTTGVIISELSGYYTSRGFEARRII